MTDEETQRQRHLAEMMIAELDGKQIQARCVLLNGFTGSWEAIANDYAGLIQCVAANIKTWHRGLVQFRIKPEPRECYVCFECFTAFKTYDREAKLCTRDHGKNAVKKVSEL